MGEGCLTRKEGSVSAKTIFEKNNLDLEDARVMDLTFLCKVELSILVVKLLYN